MLAGLYEGTRPLPTAADPSVVGKNPSLAKSGGGGRWDEVIEYRVWIKDDDGMSMNAFADYKDAHNFAVDHYVEGTWYIHVMVLIRQKWQVWLDSRGELVFNDEETITEWQPEWLLDTEEFSKFSQAELIEMKADGTLEEYMDNLR